VVQCVDMKWNIKSRKKENIKGVDLHPIIEQILLQKDITTKESVEDFFAPNYDKLHSPFLFKDMGRVVKRVQSAIDNQEIVGIFGDHDADGVSSATVLAEGLEKLGLNVDVYIPDKLTQGHGINTKAIDEFVQLGVTLMFSVDCGTSNVGEVEYANAKGLDVIITDHHHAPEILPDAFAIINPQLPKCSYPFRELSGTAVAFKVVQALFEKIKPSEQEQLKWLLDVVCVGTVADCMPLVGENRTLVHYGLIVLSKTNREGYRQLFAVSGINSNGIVANTVAFQIAPRINAPGRMSHAKHSFELLRAQHTSEAITLAQFVEDQNKERKKITKILTKRVERIVQKEHMDKSFILISGIDYPVGIVGIIAGQIAQKYQKPTGIFTEFENESRGSFRSIEDLHIVEILDECSEYIEKYGGHEQAAGAIIKNENFKKFCQKANKVAKAKLKDKPDEIVLFADAEIKLKDVDLTLVKQLSTLEPFGEGNEEPIFVIRSLVVDDIKAIGSNQAHLKMTLKSHGAKIDAIAFGQGFMIEYIKTGDRIDVLANVQKNEWNGNVSVQLNIIDIHIL